MYYKTEGMSAQLQLATQYMAVMMMMTMMMMTVFWGRGNSRLLYTAGLEYFEF